jgi:hypothetical protein
MVNCQFCFAGQFGTVVGLTIHSKKLTIDKSER